MTPERVYHITCESEAELQDWCEAIKKQQQILLNPPSLSQLSINVAPTPTTQSPTTFTETKPTDMSIEGLKTVEEKPKQGDMVSIIIFTHVTFFDQNESVWRS